MRRRAEHQDVLGVGQINERTAGSSGPQHRLDPIWVEPTTSHLECPGQDAIAAGNPWAPVHR
jgi:hypothetical protein